MRSVSPRYGARSVENKLIEEINQLKMFVLKKDQEVNLAQKAQHNKKVEYAKIVKKLTKEAKDVEAQIQALDNENDL